MTDTFVYVVLGHDHTSHDNLSWVVGVYKTREEAHRIVREREARCARNMMDEFAFRVVMTRLS